MREPELAKRLADSPEAAANSVGTSLTPEELDLVRSVSSRSIIECAGLLARLLERSGPKNEGSERSFEKFVSLFDHGASTAACLEQEQAGGSVMSDDLKASLAALLDQQQQQKGRATLESLAALLDQQQQQKGRATLESLAALLDQQQQQGGRRAWENLAALLDQQQQGGRSLGNVR